MTTHPVLETNTHEGSVTHVTAHLYCTEGWALGLETLGPG